MTKSKASILIIIVMLLFTGSALAEDLTLDDCIRLALKNHKDVVSAMNAAKTADGTVWQSFGAFLPTFGVSAGYQKNTGYLGNEIIDSVTMEPLDTMYLKQTSKGYSVGGSISWTVFNGGRNIFNFLGAKADKNYYKMIAESTEQSMVYQTKSYYYSYLQAVDKMKIAEESVKRGEEQLKLAESKYEVGSASKSDVLKAKVQYGTDKLTFITEQNKVKTALADLLYFIGLDVNSDVNVSLDYTRKDYSGTMGDALKFGMANHPGLLAAEYNMTAAGYDLKSTLGRYLPSVSLGWGKSWSGSTFSETFDLDKYRSSSQFSVSLNWTIFDGFSRKRDVTRAKSTVSNARASLDYARNNVALGIKTAYLDIERAREALDVAQTSEDAAKEDMSLIQEKYKLGAATILELLDAQVSLYTAQNQRVESEFSYNLAVAKLEQAMGMRE